MLVELVDRARIEREQTVIHCREQVLGRDPALAPVEQLGLGAPDRKAAQERGVGFHGACGGSHPPEGMRELFVSRNGDSRMLAGHEIKCSSPE